VRLGDVWPVGHQLGCGDLRLIVFIVRMVYVPRGTVLLVPGLFGGFVFQRGLESVRFVGLREPQGALGVFPGLMTKSGRPFSSNRLRP
jgi:hypothetical protein